MERNVSVRSRVADPAWLAVATRRSAELAMTTAVKELAHSTSDLAISEISVVLPANGGTRLPSPAMDLWPQ